MELPSISFEDAQASAATSIPRQQSLHLSDHDGDDEYDAGGDYSSRMEELLGGDDEFDGHGDNEEEEEDVFLYTGEDAAAISTGYRDQLRDVLGPDHEEDELDVHEVENTLLISSDDGGKELSDDELSHRDVFALHTPSTSSVAHSLSAIPPRVDSPTIRDAASTLARRFLHPTVSRLRSSTGHPSNNIGSLSSHPMDSGVYMPSQFYAMSQSSSVSNLRSDQIESPENGHLGLSKREVFRWTRLQSIESLLYTKQPRKVLSLLGPTSTGLPTVMAANGLICIGTDAGHIYVYDFKQTLQCICGNDASGKTVGPVTAIALSHDHTYVASGHKHGHVQLFDLRNPHVPARLVAPTTLASVSSGRREGHLIGSQIVGVGFVAGRHTAVVSADEHGLAFYHSLGKVLFVEAPDILRILGRYPLNEPFHADFPHDNSVTIHRPRRNKYTILAMAPLPLGTIPHSTDAYNVVALLTPTKLVVVGLKPTPRTWFKCRRESYGPLSKSKWRGVVAWYPSVLPAGDISDQKPNANSSTSPTIPSLAYSWGNMLHLIRVSESRIKQTTRSTRSGKSIDVEVGNITYEDAGRWSTEDDILALQWLNANQVAVLTATSLEVYDTYTFTAIERVPFDGLSLASPSLGSTSNGSVSYDDAISDVAHSVRAYKGKIFLLGRDFLQVGTLLTWADRILSFVEQGNFLSAINLTRSYYLNEASGNKNGLPEDPQLRRQVIGEKMYDLMVASARYTFSEDRMTDGTHVTLDGRGVDRTALFEGLVATCVRACIALGDYDFLFEDLFQQYDDNGISRIFLLQLEPFILDHDVRYVPPQITQRLIALHERDNQPKLAERVIWHIDPACLDLNQAIRLCQLYQLYDALIYVYTRGLKDYIAPVVELLRLVRLVRQLRKAPDDSTSDSIIVDAYKIYPYLANILSGLAYPSGEPLGEEEASQAKQAVYTFMFFGRSSVWPDGEGGQLVLTADEEGGLEPTYPYTRLLLRFDSESFLHSLDIAFEDAYLNDESQGMSRLVIILILLDISSSGDLPPSDSTFVNIFVARNVPKYPQFIQVTTSALHNVLTGLADDPDESTREDRQLAAEYLLSVYNPHESDDIQRRFEDAGFYRILRTWYQHDRQWKPLALTYLHDSNLRPFEIFDNLGDVLISATRANKGILPLDLQNTIKEALPLLMKISVVSTAALVDKHIPSLHHDALKSLDAAADQERYIYLGHLLVPSASAGDLEDMPFSLHTPSDQVDNTLRQQYIALQCRYHPTQVVNLLKRFPPELLDWPRVIETCEENGVYDAVVWAANWRGDPREALSKAELFEKRLALRIVEATSTINQPTPLGQPSCTVEDIWRDASRLQAMGRLGINICLQRSQDSSVSEVPLEDIWFQLLSTQVNCVQSISESFSPGFSSGKNTDKADLERDILTALRSLVRETFGALVMISSTRAVSFPRLFNRLMNTTRTASSTGTQYAEFRAILTGMLESYRSDGDILNITKHMVDKDLFETVAQFTKERGKGWAPSRRTCIYCREPVTSNVRNTVEEIVGRDMIVVSRTGAFYHSGCSPTSVLHTSDTHSSA